MTHMELLIKLDACADAVKWAEGFETLEAAWNGCQSSRWMLWLLQHVGFDDQKTLRLYACACVRRTPLADGRTVWDLLTDEHIKNAVVVAEQFALRLATTDELRAAAEAARDAMWAAWGAVWAAAEAAADAAAADAAEAATWATKAAAWAAWGAEAATEAAEAAEASQCDILREMVPFAAIQEYIDKLCAKRR